MHLELIVLHLANVYFLFRTLALLLQLTSNDYLSTVSWDVTIAQIPITKGNTFLRLVYLHVVFFLRRFRLYFCCCFSDSRSLLTRLLHTLYPHIHSVHYHSSNAMHIVIILSNKSIYPYPCIFFVKSFVFQLWLKTKEKTTHKSTLYRKTLDSRTFKKNWEEIMGRRKRGCSFMSTYAFLCLGVTKDDIHTTHIHARNATIAEIERKKQCIEFVVIVVVVCMFFFVFRLVLCISTACSLFTTVLFLCCLKFEYISVPPGAYAYCCTAYTLIALHCIPKC